jgi:hypothetical protein
MKENNKDTMIANIVIPNIENKIYTIRGKQVMIDSDLAFMYQIETKVFNQAVKRNIERFPEEFRFRLTKEEFEELRSQIVTSKKQYLNQSTNNKQLIEENQRSQIVTFETILNKRYLPYVFTEQGVAMLSGVLRSNVAIQISIKIMNAFVVMRKYIADNHLVFQRLDKIEKKQLEADIKFEKIFDNLQRDNQKVQGIFFNGQIYDSYSFIIRLIKKAKKELVVIDGYVNNEVLDMLSKKEKDVLVKLYTYPSANITKIDISRFNKQYPTIELHHTTTVHDRYLIIDNEELYTIGASLKDIGKKCFSFTLMEDSNLIAELINKL